MKQNPFAITKAEGFNHSYNQLALLMQFKSGVADVLLSNSNVFVEGSRGSGKSMYLRLLSLPVKLEYERLEREGKAEGLPQHKAYVGAYVKLAPTIFGPHEYEIEAGFQEQFRQLFNIYCAEHIANTVREALEKGVCTVDGAELGVFCEEISSLFLPPGSGTASLQDVLRELKAERRIQRARLNAPPYKADERSQPDILWEAAEAVSSLSCFRGTRVHLLVDEYDSLTANQQRIINTYFRKRDFPLAFKVGCKKHRLTLDDLDGNPLIPGGDFDPIELDDDDFGRSSTFTSYVEEIANKRLRNAEYEFDIRALLGKAPKTRRRGAELAYGGFEMTAMLSSGIVRTFLELCRDMFSRAEIGGEKRKVPIPPAVEDEIIKQHASKKWSALSRESSARPELQHFINQTAALFKEKMKRGKENQIIRLEIVNWGELTSFARRLLDQALEHEALVQPNRERLQKNKATPSRGYLLHRLLCVHFRFDPQSRWDVEISANQLEKLILGTEADVPEIADHAGATMYEDTQRKRLAPTLFDHCPILDQSCPNAVPRIGRGFLSCRLPSHGRIRDSVALLKEKFSEHRIDGHQYEVLTAEDYPPAGDIACKVCDALTQSQFVLAEMSKLSPSVSMELGLAIARRIPAFILFNTDEQPTVPAPFNSLEYIPYSITPDSVGEMIEERILPFLSRDEGDRAVIQLGPSVVPGPEECEGVFVALPSTDYYRETILPALRDCLEAAGLGPVRTESESQALQDLQRAAVGIAKSRYALIDTTKGIPAQAMYLGMAQGYRRPFGNLVNEDEDPASRVFTNARSKSELQYRDKNELLEQVAGFFGRLGLSINI